jgi:hypothetical protein
MISMADKAGLRLKNVEADLLGGNPAPAGQILARM